MLKADVHIIMALKPEKSIKRSSVDLIQTWMMRHVNWILGIVLTGAVDGKVKDVFSDISEYGALGIGRC